MTTNEKVFDFANCLVAQSNGTIKLVKHEKDDSKDECKEAATFLKLKGARVGRDLELYNFMSEISGVKIMLCSLLEELLLPIRSVPLSYSKGKVFLRDWGCEVFKGEYKVSWVDLF